MIRVHFLINKLDVEHIIALGGKKSNEKLGKKGNRCKNAANSVTGHVCVNGNVWEAAMEKSCRLPTAQSAHQTPVRAACSHNSPYPGRRRSARGQEPEIVCIFHI